MYYFLAALLSWNFAYALSEQGSSVISEPTGRLRSIHPIILNHVDSPKDSGVCTGTFISDNLLVTAGHCISHFSTDTAKVQITDYFSKAQTTQSFIVCADPGDSCIDVAYVVFPKKTYLGPTFPISLGDESPRRQHVYSKIPHGLGRLIGGAQVYGYGVTTDNPDEEWLPVLRHGVLGLMYRLMIYEKITTNWYPAILDGDSGGPMIVNNHLVAVASARRPEEESSSKMVGLSVGLAFLFEKTNTHYRLIASRTLDCQKIEGLEILRAALAAGASPPHGRFKYDCKPFIPKPI